MTEYDFLPLSPEDVPALLEIERVCFPVPWTKYMLETIFTNPNSHFFKLLADGKIAGYGGFWRVVDEAHIANLAVMPEYRGRGLGKALLNRLLITAREAGLSSVTLEVRVGNLIAQRMYAEAGFVNAGRRKGYYPDGEDAYILWKYFN